MTTCAPQRRASSCTSSTACADAVSCGATKWEKIDYFFSVVSRYAAKDLLETYFTPAQIAALKTLK